MSADQLLQEITNWLFVLIFVNVLHHAYRHPRRANFDIALLFGCVALVIAEGWAVRALQLQSNQLLSALSGSLAMALPYLLLRLVDDFAGVPRAIMRVAEVGLALSVASLFLAGTPLPVWLTLLLVVYFVVLEVYAAMVFVREARESSGVTRRRMRAVAAGSAFLGLTILAAGIQAALPEQVQFWSIAGRLLGLASGLAYSLGFAPPGWLRRAWQEPELRTFLGRAASLPRLPDTRTIVRELEQGAARSLGAPGASIGLWDRSAQVLRFAGSDQPFELAPGQTLAGRAFAEQRAVFSADAARDDPEHAWAYRKYDAQALLAAPISAGEQHLGVLSVYAPRAPIFADDDLVLVQLLADQAAVILESRALIDEATRVRAREEATRLKDDFLSSAAHDLKTPLTALTTQAQLLERRALRDPHAPVDLAGLRRIIQESRRLNRLVLELLDAARLEHGRLLGPREPVDLAALARSICERQADEQHPCTVEAPDPVVGAFDSTRILQLIENLVENAVKYSPQGGEVRVRIRRHDGEAHVSVSDRGIGIPPEDLPHLFERFHRGSNVDDRRFAGMGLGLFICRGIAEQHGGRIWADSRPGRGSTFHVALPLMPAPAEAPPLATGGASRG